jgi:hypothetical protein
MEMLVFSGIFFLFYLSGKSIRREQLIKKHRQWITIGIPLTENEGTIEEPEAKG